MASVLTPAKPGLLPHRAGSFAARAVFVGWCIGIVGLVGALAREGCTPSMDPGDPFVETPAAAVGWRVRYWLPARGPVIEVVGPQLAKRNARDGFSREIYSMGELGAWTDRLAKSGWGVVRVAETGQPRLEIYAPGNVLRWSGELRAQDFATEGAVMLDQVVLRDVVQGKVVAPFVPVGCVSNEPRRSPAVARNFF